MEMSKWRMFKFIYDYLKTKWGDKVEVVQADTDGSMLHTETKDFYEDIKDEWSDNSNFPENNKFVIKPMNKMKLGCFKIETGENIVTVFIGLRAKMYCYTIEHQRSGGYTVLKKREKGVPGHVANRHQLLIWKKVLDNETEPYAAFKMIKSEKLNVYTIEQTKVALSNFDDNRYILDD